MTDFVIIRHSKLKSLGEIGGSLSHTYRTRFTPNSDPDRSNLNENDFETPEQVLQVIKDRLPEKLRVDNVLCVEYLITASPKWTGFGTEKEQQFFDDSREFLKEKFGADNVISTHVHRDETTPHLVAYIVPLDEKTGKLNCKKWLGGKAKCSKQQTDFANKVKYLGLERGIEGSKAEHVSIKKYYATVENTLDKTVDLDNLDNLPEPGFFESKKDYVKRVLNEVLPDYEVAVVKANAVDAHKRELRMLREKIKDAEPYLTTIKYLPEHSKNELDVIIKKEGDRLHQEYEHQQKQEAEQYEKLKGTYYKFENYVNECVAEKTKTQNKLDYKKDQTDQWLEKKALTHNEVREEKQKLGGGVYEIPDYYITPFEFERGYENAYKLYKQKVAKKAEAENIASVVFSLKEKTNEQSVLDDLNDYESYVQPVIKEWQLETKQQADQRLADSKKDKVSEALQIKKANDQKKGLEDYQAKKKAESEHLKAVLKHHNNDVEKKIDRDNDFSR